MANDLISRQAAIDVFKNLIGIDCIFEEDPKVVGALIAVKEAITQLPAAEPERRCIPCSERLPEDVEIGEEYPTVIFCTDKATYVGFYEHDFGGKWWTEEDYTVDSVIAWMPLPEPYRRRKNEYQFERTSKG